MGAKREREERVLGNIESAVVWRQNISSACVPHTGLVNKPMKSLVKRTAVASKNNNF